MPGVNPPVDAEQTAREPELVLAGPDGGEVRIGPRGECDTLPDPCAYRPVIFHDADGRSYWGYLWEEQNLRPSAPGALR